MVKTIYFIASDIRPSEINFHPRYYFFAGYGLVCCILLFLFILILRGRTRGGYRSQDLRLRKLFDERTIEKKGATLCRKRFCRVVRELLTCEIRFNQRCTTSALSESGVIIEEHFSLEVRQPVRCIVSQEYAVLGPEYAVSFRSILCIVCLYCAAEHLIKRRSVPLLYTKVQSTSYRVVEYVVLVVRADRHPLRSSGVAPPA